MDKAWLLTPDSLTITIAVALLAVRIFTACLRRAEQDKTGESRSDIATQIRRPPARRGPEGPRHLILVEALPVEVLCEVITFMGLKDASAVSTVDRKVCSQLWDSPEVWISLSPHHGLQLPLSSACGLPGSMRQAFRRSLHRIDGQCLHSLGAGVCSSVSGLDCEIELFLAEAKHMVCGLLPSDGSEIVQVLSEGVEQALLLHDHTNKGMATAVQQFMEIAKRRSDIFTYVELDLFERAIDNAVALMGLLDASAIKSQDVSPGSFGCTSISLAEADGHELEGYDEDAAFELQRMQLLDHLFEELERMPEVAS
mmetsp:Transcript_41814/g.75925  ORF Transcript_41814/g.75925 Transcript_41814/m.75925 type:complete len:312 (-) Transcript_41814:176-1111(-)